MKKSNIRSIRFSDKMAELIDQQIGDNFTEKFEHLITKCAWELPEKERQLAAVQKELAEERERTQKLRIKMRTLTDTITRLQSVLDQELRKLDNL